ncbi:MAG: AAA family ATPase [Candidatus Thorarchaeota archaeon]|nr:MAG: AAA family ATPase [Candidatus Thorarchaeota archaeon]
MRLVLPLEPSLWSVKYRPTSWDQFVGQDTVLSHLKSLTQNQSFPNMIFYGPSGTGKSAAVEVYAREALGDDYASNYKLLNVRDIREMPVSKAKRSLQDLAKLDQSERTELDEYMSLVYREAKAALKTRGQSKEPNRSQMLQTAIRMFASTYTFSEVPVKILVLEEADALDNNMQQALRRTMEIYSDVTRFILITHTLSGWSPAILSRSLILRFQSPSLEEIEKHIAKIASSENITIDDGGVAAVAKESLGDLRRAINLLQVAAAGTSSVTERTVYEVNQTTLTREVHEMVSHAFSGKFLKARKTLRNLLALEGYLASEVSLEIQRDLVRRQLEPEVVRTALERLAEIDHRLTQARNPFIHLTALLASLTYIGNEGQN